MLQRNKPLRRFSVQHAHFSDLVKVRENKKTELLTETMLRNSRENLCDATWTEPLSALMVFGQSDRTTIEE